MASATRRRTTSARRGQASGKGAGVTILRAVDAEGKQYTLALSPKEPERAYVLRRGPDGAWTCDCFTARWKQGRCAHLEAIAAVEGLPAAP